MMGYEIKMTLILIQIKLILLTISGASQIKSEASCNFDIFKVNTRYIL